MKIGIAVDHGGFHLKEPIVNVLNGWGHEVRDFGAFEYMMEDDFPDFVVPLSFSLVWGEVEKGIAICGSGVGACIVANKVRGVRAALIFDSYSAHQGVEDDQMNLICLGARVTGVELAIEHVEVFLKAKFREEPRFLRRMAKIKELELSNCKKT